MRPEVCAPPMDEAAARVMTARMRKAGRDLCLSLLDAHRGRAWQALGYRSWAEYVEAELGMTRSRTYQLLDQGKVMRALQRAAATDVPPYVTAYAAGQIKGGLKDVVTRLRARIDAEPEEPVAELVAEVVREARITRAATGGEPDLAALHRALEEVVRLPAPERMAAVMAGEESRRLPDVPAVVAWLADLSSALPRGR